MRRNLGKFVLEDVYVFTRWTAAGFLRGGCNEDVVLPSITPKFLRFVTIHIIMIREDIMELVPGPCSWICYKILQIQACVQTIETKNDTRGFSIKAFSVRLAAALYTRLAVETERAGPCVGLRKQRR